MVVKFYDISVVCLGCKHKQLCSHQCNKTQMDDRKQSAQIQIEHKYVTLPLSQPDLNNIVADEEVDNAYTDTLMAVVPSAQNNQAFHGTAEDVSLSFRYLQTRWRLVQSPSKCHMQLPQDHTVMHFKGKLKHFYNYDSHSINAVQCCNIQYDIYILNCSFLSIEKVEVTHRAVRIKKSYHINQCPL